MAADKPARPIREPSYLDASIPLLTLVVLVAASVALFGMDAVAGPMQVAMILATAIATVVVWKNGHAWDSIAEAGRKGVGSVVGAIFILLAVGALIGTWNLSGTIPTLIYYGMEWIDPVWFHPVAFLLCALTSLSIGSSWTTAGTVGIGLVGMAAMLGLSPASSPRGCSPGRWRISSGPPTCRRRRTCRAPSAMPAS